MHRIIADHPNGEPFECFTWARANVQQGIERAKAEAKRFGMAHLTNFRAEPIGETK